MAKGDEGEPKPLSPASATDKIRAMAKSPDLMIDWTAEVKADLEEFGLVMGDVLHVLKNGFVFSEGLPSTRHSRGLFKYAMEAITPNSHGRTIRVICIPSVRACEIKVAKVMWVDEPIVRN